MTTFGGVILHSLPIFFRHSSSSRGDHLTGFRFTGIMRKWLDTNQQRNIRLIGNFHGMFNWHMVVQSNLDYPDFSIIRTCFSGSSFSWILICHIMCLQQNFFPSSYVINSGSNWICFDSESINLYAFRAIHCISQSSHWLRFALCSGKFHLLISELLTCSWLINIHIFDYLDSRLSGPSISSSVGCRAGDYTLLPTTTVLCQFRQLVPANHVARVSQ